MWIFPDISGYDYATVKPSLYEWTFGSLFFSITNGGAMNTFVCAT